MKFKSIFFCVSVLCLTGMGYAKDIEVVSVWPEKLLYVPKETAKVTVTLRNTGATEQEADLVVTLLTDVATERELLRRIITLAPKVDEEIVINATLQEEFGHEVVAVLMQEGREVSRAREVFTVTNHAPLVSQYAFWAPHAGSEKDIRDRLIPSLRRNYITMLEVYDWSPSTFLDFTPETDDWWAGQSHYHISKSAMKTYIDEAHNHGMKLLTYVNNAFWGTRAWEILREHPEWATYTADGQWYARFDLEETGGQPGVVPEDLHKHSSCFVNFQELQTVDIGTHALIAGMRMFDYDGARWDGQWVVSGDYGTTDYLDIQGRLNPRPSVADELGVRNYKRVKEQLRKVRPGFLFGYNYGVRFSEGGAMMPKTYTETIGDSGWILWETARGMMQGSFGGLDTWQLANSAIREEATAARRVGGEMYMHVDSGSLVYNSYLCALAFSNRAHLSSPYDLGYWYKFAIRYGGLLYDPLLEPTPATGIKVRADAPLWWENTIYKRVLSAKREQLIIHLINPPANEKIDQKEKTSPPVRKDVQVSVPVPDGSILASPWVLSPDPDTHAQPLMPSVADGVALVTVPELVFWDVVVFEFDKGGK